MLEDQGRTTKEMKKVWVVLGGEFLEGQWIMKVFDSESKASDYYDKEKPKHTGVSTLDLEEWEVE